MTVSIRRRLAAMALAAAGALAVAGPASAQSRVGTLSCDVSGGIGMIIASQKRVDCTFQSVNGRVEGYYGTISKVGLDVGVTTRGVMIWQVIAPTTDFGPFALEGDYVGASGQASAGVGASANVLVGGFNRAFSLQPVSVGAQTGVNLAVGLANLTLVGKH
jgi:hypothetical protein